VCVHEHSSDLDHDLGEGVEQRLLARPDRSFALNRLWRKRVMQHRVVGEQLAERLRVAALNRGGELLADLAPCPSHLSTAIPPDDPVEGHSIAAQERDLTRCGRSASSWLELVSGNLRERRDSNPRPPA